MNKESKWKTDFPQEEGLYWFYGYRFGKVSCGTEYKPEMGTVKVVKCRDSFMYVYNGAFMYKKEVECPNFKKVDLPELPMLLK